jgi:hypothetical protein
VNTRGRKTVALVFMLAGSAAQAAAIFPKVTNVNNSGAGSLRAAITAANANGKDGAIIMFQIGSSCGPHVIHLATALPDLKNETHIEGYTQPGSAKNTLDFDKGNDASICIVIDGDQGVDDAFTVPSSVADSMTISVQGIAFSGFTHSAVNLRGGSEHVIAGNRTGGTLGGVHLDTNSYGVILVGVHGATIGGFDNGEVNQFGDITHNPVYISATGGLLAAHDNVLRNDDIGFVFDTKKHHVAQPTGGAGIVIGGTNNTVWRVDEENAGASGLHISGEYATGNRAYVSTFANNAGDGALIDDDAENNSVDTDQINGNGGAGVRVASGRGNTIEFNDMAGNAGLGIDIAGLGVTPNDDDAFSMPDTYGNRGQNSPVLGFAGGGNTSGGISGTLTTSPGLYYIEIFASPACDANGPKDAVWLPIVGTEADEQRISDADTDPYGQGTVSFTLPISFKTMPAFITATATDGDGNTSEFSSCVPYVR